MQTGYVRVGNLQILASTVDAGKYSFDTRRDKWRKVSTWVLPFRGLAMYIPKHKLWFGAANLALK